MARAQRVRRAGRSSATRRQPSRVPAGCSERYGRLDALNAAWGTAFWGQHYGDWEHVGARPRRPPRSTRRSASTSRGSPTTRCAPASSRERDAIREHSPAPVTTNFMAGQLPVHGPVGLGARGGRRLERPLPDGRGPGEPHGAGAGRRPDPLLAGGKPWLLHGALDVSGELAAAQRRQAARRDAPQRARALRPRRRRDPVLPVARIARGCGEVPLRDAPARRYRAGCGARSSPRAPTSAGWRRCAGSACTRRRRCSGTGSRSGRRTSSGARARTSTRASASTPTTTGSGGTAVTVDLVHPERRPVRVQAGRRSRRRTCSPRAAAREPRRRTSSAGGTLVVGYFSGIVDEHDAVHPGGLMAPLRDVLGRAASRSSCRCARATAHRTYERGRRGLRTGLTGTVWADDLVLDGAEAVARYVDGPAPGGAAITRTGKGGRPGTCRPTGRRRPGHGHGRRVRGAGLAPSGTVEGLEIVRRTGQAPPARWRSTTRTARRSCPWTSPPPTC